MALAWLDDHLIETTLAQSDRALASGALVPLAMNLRIVDERGIPFQVRHASGLAAKSLARALQSGSQAAAPYDPFEPFEPAMFVADVETNDERGARSTHVLLLNKFPAIAGHVVLVTRRSAPQLGVPTHEDFVAMAQLTHSMNGLLFYNGGPIAGASQDHRHFQLVPRTGPWPIEEALTRELPFRHALVRHDLASATSPERATEALEHAFRAACAELAIDLSGTMTPLNFLATREWMMVVPRTREHWIDEESGGKISVNALGFAGLLLLRSEDLLPPLQRFGLLRMLDSMTRE